MNLGEPDPDLLSHGERKGPVAKRWEGEGLRPFRLNPSSSRALRGALVFPMGEGMDL